MPWCERCGKFYNPNTLRWDGRCPERHEVQMPASNRPPAEVDVDDALPDDTGDRGPIVQHEKVPWHLWVLLVAVVAYLGWRLVQLVVMVVT